METTKQTDRLFKFDQLLFEISSKFVNLPATEVDKEINNALKKTVEFLDIDQSVFGEFKKEDHSLQIIHGYTSYKWQENRGLMLNSIAPHVTRKLSQGEVVYLARLPDDIPPAWHEELAYATKVGLKSCLGVSLKVAGSVLGVIIFESYRHYQTWTPEAIQQIRLLAQVFSNALERKQTEIKLKQAFNKIKELSEHLKAENQYLRESINTQARYENVIAKSKTIKEVLKKIEQVAETHSTVLLLGETGTGKTMLAQLVHKLSPRKSKTMVKVNCATLPANLLESELFGHEKGAFTGAVARKIGRFEIANRSTLFLDEIGELPLDLQTKLLRVLDEGEFERLGNAASIKVDVRIIAATNRDLGQMVREGTFRSDLYYRLNVYPVVIPPLRERLEDIPEMVWTFVREFCKTMGRSVNNIPQSSFEELFEYSWPGNIRELKNVVENAMISSRNATLYLHPPESYQNPLNPPLSFKDAERSHILSALEQTNWQIKGPAGAAQMLGLKPSTLYSKMKRLNIEPHKR